MGVRRRAIPAKQGDLDGACGFYAVTNALCLVEPELDKDEVFKLVLESFLVDGDPIRFVHGTRRGSIKNTLSRTLSLLHDCYDFVDGYGSSYRLGMSMPYWRTSPKSREDVLRQIQRADYKAGSVAIIGYAYWEDRASPDEKYAHWTVVKKVQDGRLHTFDSSGEAKTISLEKVRFDDGRSGAHISRPYNIFSRDLILVSRIP